MTIHERLAYIASEVLNWLLLYAMLVMTCAIWLVAIWGELSNALGWAFVAATALFVLSVGVCFVKARQST